MNTLSLWLSLVLAATLCQRALSDELKELQFNETATLSATAHVARHPNSNDNKGLALYLAIDNPFQNTINCSGQLLTAIAKDGKIFNFLVRFPHLQVFPSGAFSYQLVYMVMGVFELPEGYVYVEQEYPPVKVICSGWDDIYFLHPLFCEQNKLEMCNGDKVRYPYMIDKYRIGVCPC